MQLSLLLYEGSVQMKHEFEFYRTNVIDPLRKCSHDLTKDGALEHEYETRNNGEYLKEMCKKHSYDIVATVFSSHIKAQIFDGRYTRDVKNWAESYQTNLPIEGMPNDILQDAMLGNTHPVIINSSAQILIEKVNEFKKADNHDKKNEQHHSAVKQLFDKMSASQNEFREWILNTAYPERILGHAFEYSVREDILMCVEVGDISEKDAAELLKSDDPLGDIFDKYQESEPSYMDEIRQAIHNEAKDAAKNKVVREKE